VKLRWWLWRGVVAVVAVLAVAVVVALVLLYDRPVNRVVSLSLLTLLAGACSRHPDTPSASADAAGTPSSDGAVPEVSGAVSSGGCGRAPAPYAAGTHPGSLQVGGRDRTFLVHLPPGYDASRPHPLVLLFHGGLGTGMQMEASALMSPIADRERFVVVYPDGITRSWNAGGCCGPPAEQNIDDVGFVAALLDHLESTLCLDRRRIFAGGMSNGAMFSHRLACDLSERVAAVAPVSGTNMTSSCAPRRPVPVMHIHGTEDRHVPWAGGNGCGIAGVPFTSVPDSLAGWQGRNGCVPGAGVPLVQQGDGRCEVQGRCPAGAEVVLCTIQGGGHAWPGGGPRELVLPACRADGFQSTSFLASEQIWSFFAAHPRP
jgi:polyhydroxybutyrate depolymerase